MPNSLDKITKVTDEEATRIIETREPLGLFYHYDNKCGLYIGIDNSYGDAWTEEFKTLPGCKKWLRRG